MRDVALRLFVNGVWFPFYSDDDGVLHIVSRHGMTPHDVFQVFFEATDTIWNAERLRFESSLGGKTLLWAWHGGNEGGDVVVISCFEQDARE